MLTFFIGSIVYIQTSMLPSIANIFCNNWNHSAVGSQNNFKDATLIKSFQCCWLLNSLDVTCWYVSFLCSVRWTIGTLLEYVLYNQSDTIPRPLFNHQLFITNWSGLYCPWTRVFYVNHWWQFVLSIQFC